jgi:hypothetical protein
MRSCPRCCAGSPSDDEMARWSFWLTPTRRGSAGMLHIQSAVASERIADMRGAADRDRRVRAARAGDPDRAPWWRRRRTRASATAPVVSLPR